MGDNVIRLSLFLLPALSLAAVEFNRDVRPILADRCFACHGPDATARGIKMRLDSESAAKADLGGRFAIVPGDASKSEMIRRVTAEKIALRMPPTHSGLKLNDREIETLKSWILEGAAWQKHWSFIPPKSPPLPAVSKQAWVRNPIDAFVLAKLDREGLSPSPEAAKTTLIRRATLDLTGLPPTPTEADAFLRDESPNAYEKVLDRLLASPRYGERIAIRWLDAARYADTNGYQTDAEREMWRWRDWVIDAFNKNKPYDRFATEQIAGDLLRDATVDQKIATGFNRNHRGNSEGGIVPEEYLVEYCVDRVETMSTVFLGLTLGCARCHNHKYDPFTQREFYSMFAYFNSIPELGRYLKYGNTPPLVKAPTDEQQAKLRMLQEQAAAVQEKFFLAESAAASARKTWERSLAAQSPAAQGDWSLIDGMVASGPQQDARFDGKRVVDLGLKGDFGFYSKFTLAAWIAPETASGPILTRAEDDDNGEGYGLYLVDGKLQANFVKRRLDDSIRVETKSKIKPGERHHVALTYDGSRVATGVQIFVDGKPQELEIIVDAINQEFAAKKEPLRIGGGGAAGRRFAGSIDDARAYDRALSTEELSILATSRTIGEIARLAPAQRSAAESAKLRLAFLEGGSSAEVTAQWRALVAARRTLATYVESVPTVMVMEELPQPKDTFLLVRGAYDKPGDRVHRSVPESLHPLTAQAPPNRLGLAQWLVDPANPLTARVAVNRFWQMYFGTGLVKTTEDFGVQGEWPSHPELLDWLATEFVRSGWDIKALQKTILMSATYRQSSRSTPELTQRDPENRLLARGPRMRLPAEMIRDQALSISGLLVEKRGGPSVKPYQPAGLWSELGDKDYVADTGEGLYRRSLYTFWKRTAAPPFMANFDSAMRESCTVRESRTDTPLQALNLMNDVTFVEASRKMAERVLRENTTGTDERLTYAFRLVTARAPSSRELQTLRGSLAFYRDHYQSRQPEAQSLTRQGASAPVSDIPARDLAAWTAVCSLLLNLDEAVTKE